MAQVLGIGYQNFKEVRTENIFYIDKTGFIREWWENADKVTLITRPRRFGKTLNMSLLECFFRTGMQTGAIYLRGFPYGMRNLRRVCTITGSFRGLIQ